MFLKLKQNKNMKENFFKFFILKFKVHIFGGHQIFL